MVTDRIFMSVFLGQPATGKGEDHTACGIAGAHDQKTEDSMAVPHICSRKIEHIGNTMLKTAQNEHHNAKNQG